MATNQEIFDVVQKAFAIEPRPRHFTNYSHCCECAEHDALLSSRDVQTLRLEDVNNPGWDPICFTTEQGFKYYLPALVRLALAGSAADWYFPQLLFHLIGDGPQNRRVSCCSIPQRQAIVTLLWHVVDTYSEPIAAYNIEEELQQAIEIWSEGAG
ncbi:MAG: hypothetical protein HZB51_17290 [Chloroflexi bacterium]|nr:hypothetical protein [Chloroflexota bacterium]